MPKFVFISYAQANADEYLKKFVDELESEVLPHLVGVGVDDVVFFDGDRIENGEYWRTRLSNEITACKACVAICTPAFAASQFCGKELRVFLDRLEQWTLQQVGAREAATPVFPVLWVAPDVPAVLDRFQFKGPSVPPDYLTAGLRTMYRLKKYAERRKELVTELATTLARAARKVNLPAGVGIPDFDNIASAFHQLEAPVRHGVAVLPLLRGGAQAVPYGDGRSVASIVQTACGAGVAQRFLDPGKGLAERLAAARAGREVTLVVTDLPTLADPLFQPEIAIVNGALAAPALVVVLRDPMAGSPAAEENDALTVRGAFDVATAAGAEADYTTARSTKSTEELIARRVLALRKALIEQQAPAAAVDHALRAAAAEQGVRVDQQPIVTGPEVKAA